MNFAELLRCPHCRESLVRDGRALRCENGHSFDIARQGYVSLVAGGGLRHHGDTREMVAARAAFLATGHFDPIADAVTAAAAVAAPGAVVDVGAGTGYYTARALDAAPKRTGLALDASKHAAARAARAHPRLHAVVCDTWAGLPVRDGVAAVVLNVFAPRNPAEMRRVLHDEGRLVIAHPTPRHLQEISGLIGMQEDKEERITQALDPWFELESKTLVEFTLQMDPAAFTSLTTMGPSSRHMEAGEPHTAEATASVTVAVWRPSR